MGQSEALLKEKLYWKKGSIERKALLKERLNWNKFQNLVQFPKFSPSSEIWLKFWNLAKYLKFCQKREIWWKFWNLVKILKFGWNSQIWLNFWNLAKYLKFCQKREIYVKFNGNWCWTSPTWSQVQWGQVQVQRGEAELNLNLTELNLSGVARGDPPQTPIKSIEAKLKFNEAKPSWTSTWPRCTCSPPSATSVQCWRVGRQVHRGGAEVYLSSLRVNIAEESVVDHRVQLQCKFDEKEGKYTEAKPRCTCPSYESNLHQVGEVQHQLPLDLMLVHFRPHLCHGYTDQYHSCKRSIITDCNLTTCLFAIGATPKEMQLNCHRGAVKELFLPYQKQFNFYTC